MKSVLVLNGPNLNLLGEREPEVYGKLGLAEINKRLEELGRKLGMEVHFQQSNSEGILIDFLQEARQWADGVVINPGGYTTTSVALLDTVKAIPIPVIEVHLSNIHAREAYRRHSMIALACIGSITGFGWRSYSLALRALSEWFDDQAT